MSYLIVILKSNMDRFIGYVHIIEKGDIKILKSNMDRFIELHKMLCTYY